jgi:hypothetical protein
LLRIPNEGVVSRFINWDEKNPDDRGQKPFENQDPAKLQVLADDILQEIKLTLEGNGGFGGKPYKINTTTVDDWLDAASYSERCIFFNTYIKMNDWHNPNIQMHLCLQKSIEQKSNLLNIQSCHSAKGENKEGKVNKDRFEHIFKCTNNGPSYRHYRLLFLPISTKEFKTHIIEHKSFFDNLKFSALQHSALSIQLGVLTADDLIEFINSESARSFFADETTLSILGLNKEFAELIRTKQFGSMHRQEVIDCLVAMSNIPHEKSETGMDFMIIQRPDGVGKSEDIWTGFLDNDSGLNYAACEDKINNGVRREFTKRIMDFVLFESNPGRHASVVSNVDPLFEYNKNREQFLIQNRFHPLLRAQ